MQGDLICPYLCEETMERVPVELATTTEITHNMTDFLMSDFTVTASTYAPTTILPKEDDPYTAWYIWFIVSVALAFLALALGVCLRKRHQKRIQDDPDPPEPLGSVGGQRIPSLPSLSAKQWIRLVKSVLLKYFMCYQVKTTNESGEEVECLHLPFLLRRNAPLEECQFHWPLNVENGNTQIILEFQYFPVTSFIFFIYI